MRDLEEVAVRLDVVERQSRPSQVEGVRLLLHQVGDLVKGGEASIVELPVSVASEVARHLGSSAYISLISAPRSSR